MKLRLDVLSDYYDQTKKIAFTLKLFQSTGGKKESKSKLKYDPKQQNWKKKDGGMEGFKKKVLMQC